MSLIKKRGRELFLMAIILLIGVIVSLRAPAFFSVINITSILYGNAIIGIMAIGMMIVITTANIDVSVGAQFAVCNMICAAFVKATDGRYAAAAVLISMVIGMALGMFNGLLIAKLNIPAIVVTLGTMNIMRGGIYYLTNGNWIDGLSGPFTRLASSRVLLNVPMAVYIWLLVAVITYVVLYRTNMGRNILAIGGNLVAATRVGISKLRVYLFAFGYLGALVGLGGAVSAAKLKIAQPSNGIGYEMDLIAAAIIGGTQFSGGVASILGTVLGVLLLGVIDNGLVLAKVPVYWQDLATGAIIIIAVTTSALREFAPARKKTRKEAVK
ncbi:MAG: ABC transporter permease [Oscillospiraceae bacterium]|nr:ABC transporter permease [Oscillospiraceae bacterium]